MSAPEHPVADTLVFGVFELDSKNHTLTHRGTPVRLQHQPCRLLETLVARAGEVVTRDELRLVLWAGDTVLDFEHALNFCIYRVRRALGDSAESPRYVETVARRGYRFIAPVSRRSAAPHLIDDVKTPPLVVHQSRPSAGLERLRLAAVVAILLLSGSDTGWDSAGRSVSASSLAAYERGRALVDQGPANTRRAVAEFAEAARLEPGFAATHAALARAYLDLGFGGQLRAAEAFSAARDAAETALAIEDRFEAHFVLATVAMFHDWDWPKAEAELARAEALAPANPCVNALRARYASALGQHDVALAAIDRAEAARPASPSVLVISGHVRLRAGRLHEAQRKFNMALQLSADQWIRFRLFDAYRHSRNLSLAVTEAAQLMTETGASRADVDHFAGLPPALAVDRFLRMTAQYLEHTLSTREPTAVRSALVRAAMGDHEAALDWLERAVADRDATLIDALGDPNFDGLRAEPRFRAMSARMGYSQFDP